MPNNFKVTGRVERFPGKMGWHHVRVPVAKTKNLKIKRPKWGLIPARFTVGSTTWESSLLPYGDGTLFVALKASIRKKEKISKGDRVNVQVKVL